MTHPLPDDVRAAREAVAEARRFAAEDARRRAGIAAFVAAGAVVAVVAADLLKLGVLVALPVLLLGPAHSATLRRALLADEPALRRWWHLGASLFLAASVAAAGAARGRTDLAGAAALASLGALVVLQGLRGADRPVLGLGVGILAVGVGATFAAPEALPVVSGLALAAAAGLVALAAARLFPRPVDAQA